MPNPATGRLLPREPGWIRKASRKLHFLRGRERPPRDAAWMQTEAHGAGCSTGRYRSPQARGGRRKADASAGRPCPDDLRRGRPALHRRDDLSGNALDPLRPDARHDLQHAQRIRALRTLREIAIYDAKLWYDTKTGPHFHFYSEDSEELSDIPDEWLPAIDIPAPDGMRIAAIDVIVRLKKA